MSLENVFYFCKKIISKNDISISGIFYNYELINVLNV